MRIQNGVDVYNRSRLPGEIDLIKEVRDLLVANGLQANVTSSYDNHRFIIEGIGKNSEVQRYCLNKYWQLMLMSVHGNTTDERYCLISNGEVSDWLKLFRVKIIPCIVANDLPIQL